MSVPGTKSDGDPGTRAILRSPAEQAESGATTRRVPRERVFVGTGLFWGLIVGVALAIGVIIAAAQNTGNTTINFLGWEFTTPLIVLILGAMLIGVVLDEIFGIIYRSRKRRTMRDRDQLEVLRRSEGLD